MAKQIIKHSHKSRVNMNFSLIGYAVITYQVDSVSNLSYFLNDSVVTMLHSSKLVFLEITSSKDFSRFEGYLASWQHCFPRPNRY